jgi:hypothetical protein
MSGNLAKLRALAALLLLALLSAAVVSGQKQKPWTEWSAKEAQQMLSSSPWAQTQVDTNTAEMFYSPTSRNATNANSRTLEGATNQEIKLFYYIRFFTARPVREALARLYEIKEKPNPETTSGLHNFAELKASNLTIIAVAFECSDGRFSGKVMQAFQSAVTAALKNTTYLERNDGKRLFIQEYVPPGPDGFGARFVFPRLVDGKEFVTSEVNEIRFVTENWCQRQTEHAL